MVEQAAEYREAMMETIADAGRGAHGCLPRRSRDLRRHDQGRIRKGTLAFDFVPILCGSAFKNKGVQPMLDAVVDFMPSPLDIPPAHGTITKGGEEMMSTARPTINEPFSALAFKIVADPFGKLTYFRVYSGEIAKGEEVYNSVKEDRERLGRILLMHANQREDLEVAMAGDIVAGLGFKNVTTGDTLCDRSTRSSSNAWSSPSP